MFSRLWFPFTGAEVDVLDCTIISESSRGGYRVHCRTIPCSRGLRDPQWVYAARVSCPRLLCYNSFRCHRPHILLPLF